MKLVRSTDDREYTQSTVFAVGEGFNFVFITSNSTLTDETKKKVIVFRIV